MQRLSVRDCEFARQAKYAPAIGALLVGASPWMQEAERAELIAAVVAKPLRWRADKLAARVGLTAAERERLNIRTIGAVDLDKAARKRP